MSFTDTMEIYRKHVEKEETETEKLFKLYDAARAGIPVPTEPAPNTTWVARPERLYVR